MAAFYLDHNVALDVATRLHHLGHEAQTARDLGLERAGDEVHVLIAARSGWVLVTHNAGDFELLHRAWRHWSREWGVAMRHSGVLILETPILPGVAAERLDEILKRFPSLMNRLFVWHARSEWTETQ